jgi:hypothetical protein
MTCNVFMPLELIIRVNRRMEFMRDHRPAKKKYAGVQPSSFSTMHL